MSLLPGSRDQGSTSCLAEMVLLHFLLSGNDVFSRTGDSCLVSLVLLKVLYNSHKHFIACFILSSVIAVEWNDN